MWIEDNTPHMEPMKRRKMLRKSAIAALPAGIALAGCSSGQGGQNGSGQGGQNGSGQGGQNGSGQGGQNGSGQGGDSLQTLSIGFTSAAEATDPHIWYGSQEIAPNQYGLNCDVTVFDTADLTTQALYGGDIDVARFGPGAGAALVDSGRTIDFFYSTTVGSDYVLVAQPNINSLEEIISKEAPVGVGSPTALEGLLVGAVLFERNIIDSVDEINFQRVGSSSARMAAMESDDIAVSAQHYSQWLTMTENGNYNNLGMFSEMLDQWVQQNLVARPQVISEKQAELSYLCTSFLQASRELYNNFDLYVNKIRQYVSGGGPKRPTLRQTYDLIAQVQMWPPNGDLSIEEMQFMFDLANQMGVTEGTVSADERVNRAPLESALERVGRVSMTPATGTGTSATTEEPQ